ncbi:jg26357, partial [Pararge aegeria aegeria]
CWNGDHATENAALVDPQRGGQTTTSESLETTSGSGLGFWNPPNVQKWTSVKVIMMMKEVHYLEA